MVVTRKPSGLPVNAGRAGADHGPAMSMTQEVLYLPSLLCQPQPPVLVCAGAQLGIQVSIYRQ